jgi:hypothetical protein
MLLFDLKVWLQMTLKRLEDLIPHRIGGNFGVGAPRFSAPSSKHETCVMVVR